MNYGSNISGSINHKLRIFYEVGSSSINHKIRMFYEYDCIIVLHPP